MVLNYFKTVQYYVLKVCTKLFVHLCYFILFFLLRIKMEYLAFQMKYFTKEVIFHKKKNSFWMISSCYKSKTTFIKGSDYHIQRSDIEEHILRVPCKKYITAHIVSKELGVRYSMRKIHGLDTGVYSICSISILKICENRKNKICFRYITSIKNSKR